ncbi:hypothetical protein Q1695_000933 [Nippostrongylus brasiliensis]|nr:hypothetical protein Q1695_000933 [Nippostrongylus brasiliensis]
MTWRRRLTIGGLIASTVTCALLYVVVRELVFRKHLLRLPKSKELRHESLNEHFLKKAPTSAKCIGSVLYATKNGGRLGNIMFELLGLYAIAEKTGRAPVVYENYMNDKIKELSGNHPHVASLFYDADTSECGTPTFIDLHYKGCCKFDQEIIDGILAHESHQAVTLKLFYLQYRKKIRVHHRSM